MGLQPHLIRVLNSILFFTIEIFSCLPISSTWFDYLPPPMEARDLKLSKVCLYCKTIGLHSRSTSHCRPQCKHAQMNSVYLNMDVLSIFTLLCRNFMTLYM